MEATAASAARGVSMSQSSSPSRKQWRVVSEQPARNAGNEELDRSRLGQSDERTIYEVQQGQEHRDVMEFCSIQMDGIVSVDDGIVQQRIHNLARQREEMQQVEIELRAQLIAKAEIVEMQSSFDAQFKEQSSTMSRLQEQLREKEQSIHDLERKMEEKERELHAVRLDNEAAWAKEDLLREQSNEIANYRREHDSIEAERAHHRQQIHELQEHIQEKERQLLELQDQHRVAQETILYKDEQIREAQAWMGRVQEIDVLQSSTLQAELRERTEQFNQLWLGSQRQFAEMERMHMQAIQQYQRELAALRGNTGVYNGESSISQNVSSDGSQIAQNNGNLVEANGGGTPNGNSGGLANGNTENGQQYASSGNSSSQTNHAPSLPITPSIIGIPSYLPPGQVSAMHPYVMHQQGAGQAVGSHIPQSHVGHFHSVPAMTSFHQWQNPQAPSDGLTKSSADQFSLSQAEENSSRSGFNYSYGFSINEPTLQQDYLSNAMSQKVDPSSQISSTQEAQTLESVERSYFVDADADAQHNLQQISSQFHEALRLEPLNNSTDMKAHENEVESVAVNEPVSQDVMTEQPSSTASPSPLVSSVQPVHVNEASLNCASDAVLSAEQTNSLSSGTIPDSALLDERALLASIVRTIPPGGKIRISSTLPNRLGKMLAPLRWHDYKKIYGKLDDFVASHPELFVIEGDYIQLQEGAQGIIAATAARAKVAAAAASSPYLSFFPPVAVTPMADFGRVKKMPSTESKPVGNVMSSSHPSTMQTQYSNGSAFNVTGNLSNVKILSKPKDPMELNGQPLHVHAENGTHSDRSGLGNSQSKVPVHSRPVANFNGKQPGSHRTATGLPSRR